MIVESLNLQALMFLSLAFSLVLWIAKWAFVLRFRSRVMRGMSALASANPRPARRQPFRNLLSRIRPR